MKNLFRSLLLIISIALSFSLYAQISIPKGYFSAPLKIGLQATGSFGEVRPNHMHSGIDFSVQKTEGIPVYAVADGVVSRIKVSPVGFGNALYIDHPNGFTSVYGHLKAYNDTISSYVFDNQYKLKSFEIDLFPAGKKDMIRVKKGQLIGYAGNSGSSGGAHLHFELRNTRTERIINPLLFDFGMPDKFAPYIDFVKIYPEDEKSYIGPSSEAQRFNVRKKAAASYNLLPKDTIALWGKFSFGIQAFDYNQSQTDRNGWYQVEMFSDKARFFWMTADSFAFDETRYINASIDYAANFDYGNRVVVSKKLPGNKLSVVKNNATGGVLTYTDDKIHEIVMKVSDQAGNSSVLRFWVKPIQPEGNIQVSARPAADTSRLMSWKTASKFAAKGVNVQVPAGCLYDNIQFRYRCTPGLSGMYSDIHYLHDAHTPLQSRITVSVNAADLPAQLRPKALLARIDRNGKRNAAGGAFEDGYVSTATNLFDGYAIVVDTVAPVIKPYPENSKSKTALRFRVSDNFSGIAKYRGELNGKWVLVLWDPKNQLMMYKFDKMVQPGKNEFKLTVTDEKGNFSSYSCFIMK